LLSGGACCSKLWREVSSLVRIALDAMGGDHAPGEVIQGGLLAVMEMTDLHLLLVGPQERLKTYLAGVEYPQERVEIVDASEVITDDEAPALAVRRKRNASLTTAVRLIKEGVADAAVSAGNTGALMAAGLLVLGRMPDIERPALSACLSVFSGGSTVLLDVGANMDASAEHLLQYAVMGTVYAREILGKREPKVALLNVGTEEGKGNEQVKEAYGLLKGRLPGFVGNVEARDVFGGVADVVVCDGFVGNILLKTAEGLSAGIFGSLREAFAADLRGRVGATLLLPQLQKLKKRMDYSEHGGAPLLGVDGVCIKSHGSSKAQAIRNAVVRQAYCAVKLNINEQIRKQLLALQPTSGRMTGER